MKGRKLRFVAHISKTPMPEEGFRAMQELLAKFIARAYREDHPALRRRGIPAGKGPAAGGDSACSGQ